MDPLKGQPVQLFAWEWKASKMLAKYGCPKVVQDGELMRPPGVYMKPSKKTRQKYASDVAAENSEIGIKQGRALQKHSYSARCATKMLLGILFARLDASIKRTVIGSERVYRPSRAFQLSDR